MHLLLRLLFCLDVLQTCLASGHVSLVVETIPKNVGVCWVHFQLDELNVGALLHIPSVAGTGSELVSTQVLWLPPQCWLAQRCQREGTSLRLLWVPRLGTHPGASAERTFKGRHPWPTCCSRQSGGGSQVLWTGCEGKEASWGWKVSPHVKQRNGRGQAATSPPTDSRPLHHSSWAHMPPATWDLFELFSP